MDDELGTRAHQATESRGFEALARVGYAISGVLHVLVGVIAVRLALGSEGAAADQSGALSQLADRPLGGVVLWVGVVGFGALALERLAEAAWGGPRGDRVDRAAHAAKTGGKGVLYLAAAFTTSTFARGASSSSAEQTSDVTATLLQAPLGRVLLAVLGLAVAGVGGYHVVKGVRKGFLDDLEGGTSGELGRAVVRVAQVGYVAKGLALVVVGGLFLLADIQSDASEATGLDGALTTLGEQPGGPVVLGAVGLGFVAYGLYSFVRARHARM